MIYYIMIHHIILLRYYNIMLYYPPSPLAARGDRGATRVRGSQSLYTWILPVAKHMRSNNLKSTPYCVVSHVLRRLSVAFPNGSFEGIPLPARARRRPCGAVQASGGHPRPSMITLTIIIMMMIMMTIIIMIILLILMMIILIIMIMIIIVMLIMIFIILAIISII